MSAPASFYLWLDLETTSADPLTTTILEVGAALTPADADLEVLWQVNAPVREVGTHPDITRAQCQPQARAMHDASGLWGDIEAVGSSLVIVEQLVLAGIDAALASRGLSIDQVRLTMAGSGVERFDRLIVNHAMPLLAQRLTFWCMDVSSLRRLARSVLMVERPDLLAELEELCAAVAHRALADVYAHRDVLLFLSEHLRLPALGRT